MTQSLAGRTAIVTLLPFSISELVSAGYDLSRDEYVYRGFLPRIYADGLDPTTANEEHYRTVLVHLVLDGVWAGLLDYSHHDKNGPFDVGV